jgi:hypothetical protein
MHRRQRSGPFWEQQGRKAAAEPAGVDIRVDVEFPHPHIAGGEIEREP